MRPHEYRTALQAYATQQWPGVGIEVQVQVWQPAGTCERCGIELERYVSDSGQPAGIYHLIAVVDGWRVRQPHYSVLCTQFLYAQQAPDIADVP